MTNDSLIKKLMDAKTGDGGLFDGGVSRCIDIIRQHTKPDVQDGFIALCKAMGINPETSPVVKEAFLQALSVMGDGLAAESRDSDPDTLRRNPCEASPAQSNEEMANIDTNSPLCMHDKGKCIQTTDIPNEIPIRTGKKISSDNTCTAEGYPAEGVFDISQQPDEWTKEVLEILDENLEYYIFGLETAEYGTVHGWKAGAERYERLIATAPKPVSIKQVIQKIGHYPVTQYLSEYIKIVLDAAGVKYVE